MVRKRAAPLEEEPASTQQYGPSHFREVRSLLPVVLDQSPPEGGITTASIAFG